MEVLLLTNGLNWSVIVIHDKIALLLAKPQRLLLSAATPGLGPQVAPLGCACAPLQKTKIMASGPITSWEIGGETVETMSDFIFWGAPKSLQMGIAAMKLKDAYSLEGKL